MFQKYLAITVLGLLTHLIGIGSAQLQSPCPNIFQYVRNGTTGEIEGYVEISDVPKGVAVHIMMRLSVAIALPTKYVGSLELAVSRELAIEFVKEGRPLVYRVRFPLQRPVPLVTRILYNDLERCSGRRAIGPIVTSITLEHTLFPPGVAPPSQDPSIEVPGPGLFPTPTLPSYSRPTLPPYTRPTPGSSATNGRLPDPNFVVGPTGTFEPVDWNSITVPISNFDSVPNKSPVPVTETNLKPATPSTPARDSIEIDNNCGRPRKGEINLLISKGERTQPGDWPWLVAIFVSRIKLEFQCAASLVSAKHVLTAAHCLKSSGGQDLPASTLLAVAGRYKLRGWSEKGSVTYEVLEYKVHTEYGRSGAGFDSDLAVVTLMEAVTFGKLIMPICLWSGPRDIESVVGKSGFVVGWGRDEAGNPVTEEPRMTKVPIVSQEECLRSNADFVEITSNRTLCGGAKDGSGPCNGDSGGGLVMFDPQKQRYHLRGVVSLSLLDRATGACDLTQFVVYTDIAQYLEWIESQIAT